MTGALVISDHVSRALRQGEPVVALESTVYSRLGLPQDAGRRAWQRCLAACGERGVVGAVCAIGDGAAIIGLPADSFDQIAAADRKVAERDLPVAVAQRWPLGVTTVSATLALAAAAGITVFATGGIGGVHRVTAGPTDVSADLSALARHPLVTVCAGAKAFLDLPATLEQLEALAVPVLGWRTAEFPAFYSTSSGLGVGHVVETAAEVAAIHRAHRELGGGGMILAVPIPPEAAIAPDVIERAVTKAHARAAAAGVSGAALTPFVLATIAEATDDRSVDANVELVVNNTAVAAEVAVQLAPGR